MSTFIYDLYQKVGVWGILKAIGTIIYMLIKSVFNKTNLLTEYHKECDKTSKMLNDVFNETEEGCVLLAKAKTVYASQEHSV
jgi:hypothetical protein